MADVSQLPVLELLQHGVKSGDSISKEALPHLERLLESGKAMLRTQAAELIRECNHLPLLSSYSNDGTPLKTYHRIAVQRADGQNMVRVGQQSLEVLVQNQFLRYFDGGGIPRSVAVIQDPVPLTKGKTGDAVFACAKEMALIPRDYGHRGVNVIHLCFDGALHDFLVRRTKQHHLELAVARAGAIREEGLDPAKLLLMDWTVATQCVAHACHNGLKWGMGEVWTDKEKLKDLWEIFAALKNSAGLLHQWLPEWLSHHLVYRPAAQLPAVEEASILWSALGLPADRLCQVVHEWQLCWSDGELQVRDDLEGNDDLPDEVANVILEVLSIGGFTDSRWLSVGRSCRNLCCCLLFGLDSLVDYVHDHRNGQYYINGYKKLAHSDNKDYVVVCGLAAYPTDAALELILEDPRAAQHAPTWREAAQEEIKWIQSWDARMWQSLVSRGLAKQLGAYGLQHKVMQASLTSLAFMEYHAFAPAMTLPWSLFNGCIEDNLEALARGPEPTEAVSWKIQRLLQEGGNRHEIAAGVRLLGECSWSTTTTEQMHASVTLLHRHHPSYELNTLLVRSGLHSLRRLVPGSSQEERMMVRLANSMDKLDSRQPQKITGRKVLFRDMVATIQGQARAKHHTLSVATYNQALRLHGQAWAELSWERQEEYEAEAQALAEERADALQVLIADTAAKLGEVRAKHEAAEEAKPFGPLLFSTSTLTEQDIEEWQAQHDRLAGHRHHVNQLRAAALQAPELPTEAEVEILESMPCGDAADQGARRPKWFGIVCQMREQLRPCGLRIQTDAGPEFYAILYIKKSPYEVHALRMLPVDSLNQEEGPMCEPSDIAFLNEAVHCLRFTDFPIVAQGELPDAPLDKVHVIKQLLFRAPCHALSALEPLTLDELAAGRDFSAEAAGRQTPGQKANKRTRHAPGSLLESFPGMAATLGGAAAPPQKARGSADPAPAEDDQGEEGAEFVQDDDAAKQAFFDELERQRPEVAGLALPPRAQVDFRSTMRAYGDTVQGQVARGGQAQQWCKQKGLQQTQKFRIALLAHGEAEILGNAWAARMQFLYDSDRAGLMAPMARRARTLGTMVWPEDFKHLRVHGSVQAKAYAKELESLTV